MKRAIVAALALLAISTAVPASFAADFLVPEGTKITVAFDQDVSSKYAEPGDQVPLHLVEPIEIGGQIIVDAGAKGSARVKSVKSAGRPGKPGRVEVELLQLTPNGAFKSIDDKPIPIMAVDTTLIAEGKGRKTLSWLFIFGLFIKGTQGEIKADQPIEAIVTEGVMIEVN